jgi:hypothetical protein
VELEEHGQQTGAFVVMVFALLVLFRCGCAWAQSAGPASAVYGQLGSFTTAAKNNPTGVATSPTATGLFGPDCVRVDPSGSTFVCDTNNNRIVRFAAGSLIAASFVWGWPSFTVTGNVPVNPPTASSLSNPADVGFYDGGMFVVDQGNNRVVFYASGQFVASQVWGQPNFVTKGLCRVHFVMSRAQITSQVVD